MKVLVYCPAGPKGYGWKASIDSIRALQGAAKIVIRRSENGDGLGDKAAKHDDVLARYQEARDLCLAGEYDALLTVESDIIVPPDALGRLVAVVEDAPKTGIVHGLYCFRRSDHEWCTHRPGRPGKPPLLKSFSRMGLGRIFWGKVHVVGGCGLGCTLIMRWVLERLEFRHTDNPDMYCDYYLSQDANDAGIVQRGHCGVVCGHIRHETGDVLWPAPNVDGYEVRPLDSRRRY